MRLTNIFILLTVIYPQLVTPIPVLTVIEIAKTGIELLLSLYNTFEIANTYGNLVDTPESERDIMINAKFDEIGVKLDDIVDELKDISITSMKIFNSMSTKFKYGLTENNIIIHKIHIDTHYSRMIKFAKDCGKYQNSTIIEYANVVTSNQQNSAFHLMDHIYSFVLNTNFLSLLNSQIIEQDSELLCNSLQSPQQIFYNILTDLLITNYKSYLILQFSYFMKSLHMHVNFTQELIDTTNDFKSKTNALINSFKPFIQKSSTVLWRCDPSKHILGKTYDQITNLLQGFILNQVNLDPEGDCSHSCSSFEFLDSYNCRQNSWCKKQKGCENIVNCQMFGADMTVCLSRDPYRRYDFVNYNNGRKLGKTNTCWKKNTFILESYKDWIFWTCSYCFCLCDDGPKINSDRYINLRVSMSNITANRVVTGLRFVKKNKIIHLQVQEGKLLPHGSIDLNTVKWVPVENYKITDKDIYVEQDYHMLSWKERSIYLEDIIVDHQHLVTGVRFRRIGTHLDLEVLQTPFNVTTGKLINLQYSSFKDSGNINIKHKFGSEVPLIKPDVPINFHIPSRPFEGQNIYIKFTHSDYDKDAAQRTIPFFDIQNVSSSPAVPLGGVGIYHKSHRGSGGFIAPKIFTYYVNPYIVPPF